MIKEIMILSNASVRLVHESGLTENVDILKPLIDKLNVENKINEETIVTSSLGANVKLSDWYDLLGKIS